MCLKYVKTKENLKEGSMILQFVSFFTSHCLVPAHTKLYGCQVRRRHHLERKDSGGFDPNEYEKFPSKYISTFSKKVRHIIM